LSRARAEGINKNYYVILVNWHNIVMKPLLITLCFSIWKLCHGQEIELQGKFGASFIGGESIEFIGKDSFYFSGFYCTYGVHGKGRCEVRDNYLYLYFEKSKAKSKKDTIKAPITTKINNIDSIGILNISCVDNFGDPVYAIIQLRSNNKRTIGVLTDTSGHASFTIKPGDVPITLETSAIGFEPQKLNIESYAGYNIKIFHNKNELVDKELNNGEMYVYEIEDLTEELITMRPGKSSERFRKYQKKK
jgi:hypothetical protein